MDRCCVGVGYRFHPTDFELIEHFLSLKNNPDSESTSSTHLPEIDLYGEAEPWSIWNDYGGPSLIDEDLFFFTRLKKHGRRINRRIGSGTWSQGEPSKPVFDSHKHQIGRKTKLRYENKVVPGQHGGWLMEEYVSSALGGGDFAICRLKENRRKCQLEVEVDGEEEHIATRKNQEKNKRKYCQHDDGEISVPQAKKQRSDEDQLSFNVLPEGDFLMQELMGGLSTEEMEQFLGNDPPTSSLVEVLSTDDQEFDDWLGSIDFSPQANNLQSCSIDFRDFVA